jgi:hypothetical protein
MENNLLRNYVIDLKHPSSDHKHVIAGQIHGERSQKMVFNCKNIQHHAFYISTIL